MFGEISFLDTSDAGAAATVRAEEDVRGPPHKRPARPVSISLSLCSTQVHFLLARFLSFPSSVL